jgi:hypothetical protein
VIPDAEIARQYGIVPETVCASRKRRGISPAKRISYEHLLGSIPDNEIAEQYGITVQAVFIARKRRGIPPAPQGHAEKGG